VIKVLTVVGARPNFMKAAPIAAAIAACNRTAPPGEAIEHRLVHTGQHYDAAMSESFFADLGLPAPDVHLGAGSASHAVQTAEIMKKFEPVLAGIRPDVVVVVGDVNSTVACALVTAKAAFDADGSRPLIAHVEAGLRSFDRTMPEEINRIVTDHLSDLLFVTEESGERHLRDEGIVPARIHFVGNTMIDSLLACEARADASSVLDDLGLRRAGAVRRYALLTLHRPANVDDPRTFLDILSGLEELGAQCPIVFPVHPRTASRIEAHGLAVALAARGVLPIEPRGYLDFLCLMKHATIVVTDSGGIQEETTCLGVACVTVRENTERPITVTRGTNVVAGTEPSGIRKTIRTQMTRRFTRTAPDLWDGKAATRIVGVLVLAVRERTTLPAATLPATL
jgi:UDP-N-acetylglucosamine 2-epimerase (non-hydrolysing)